MKFAETTREVIVEEEKGASFNILLQRTPLSEFLTLISLLQVFLLFLPFCFLEKRSLVWSIFFFLNVIKQALWPPLEGGLFVEII